MAIQVIFSFGMGILVASLDFLIQRGRLRNRRTDWTSIEVIALQFFRRKISGAGQIGLQDVLLISSQEVT